ncbi:ABC transporter ATP-binding protein [Gorillibacterium massiliense]|uniref:ABC transporter ATP-binding protein n=1 Tax=Gorillibacterium massiliense TaxID=1280390 RepID=UPI0004BB04F0|nr:ABC transporter ATP-binding protein [Gorillibacterium massiliense]
MEAAVASTIPALRLSGVTHVYVTEKGATLSVDDIGFQIEPGEFVSLLGPSGCGKTTLLSIIAGLIRPTEGGVEVYGKAVKQPSPKVGYMLQQDYLFPWRTIFDNALIGLELNDAVTRKSKAEILRLLDEMGLLQVRDHYPSQLSGGMRQRAALVRTLATNPDLLLLDEPFSALDYQTKLQMEDLVANAIRNHGKTALLVTHDISEAIALSDRVLVLERNPGRIRREFTVPEEIRRAVPLDAREKQGFHRLFHDIWRELETPGGRKGT